ncbi:hypothetical protein ACWDYH_39210 [Nocardia goodfellowii]
MTIPVDVSDQATRLATAVATVVPARTDTNLIIGTWNLRELGNLTPPGTPPPLTHLNATGAQQH